MSKTELLKKKMYQWAMKEHFPLLKENERLKMENELLMFSLNQEKLKVEQHDFERNRYRNIAQRYQKENRELMKIIKREGIKIG